MTNRVAPSSFVIGGYSFALSETGNSRDAATMARYTDSVCQICRREGLKLYLKGTRCESPKCAIERRNIPPGMHGYRRGKPSEYGTRLREKQKLKRFYGV